MAPDHIQQLEQAVTDVCQLCAAAGDQAELQEFMQIIHRPGWTTLPEQIFTTAIVEAIATHAEAITTMRGQLLRGAREVGTGEPAVIPDTIRPGPMGPPPPPAPPPGSGPPRPEPHPVA